MRKDMMELKNRIETLDQNRSQEDRDGEKEKERI